MTNPKQLIFDNLKNFLERKNIDATFEVSLVTNSDHGDFATNIALVVSKQVGKSPREIAEEIIKFISESVDIKETFEKIEVAGPGFINFYLSEEYLKHQIQKINNKKEAFGKNSKNPQKIIVEFAHPNTHKEFHIGHLRNITLGESISRLLESQGMDVSRVNYQGDVGMHVAKALHGVRKLLAEKHEDLKAEDVKPPSAKALFLGLAYSTGSKSYEEDEEAKKEITNINKQIYARDPEIMPIWETTRRWSLEYFDSIYKKMGTAFKRLFFESEVYESGRDIVLSHVADGIFVKDAGAVIFPGEKFGLHNRVFVTSEGNPTYEAKEMGLAPLEYKEFKFDNAIHVVGPEQAGYFEVVFKALEQIDPNLKGREKHLVYGFVQLKDGKMSSRMGNIVRGEWLLDEAKKRISKSFPELDDSTAETVAIGAVKYSMLKFGRTSDIQFSFEDSINLEGNSGPYLQYTYTRTQSVLRKFEALNSKSETNFNLDNSKTEKEEEVLLRFLTQFPYILEQAANEFAPNLLCNYLFELSQKFNNFYQKHKIIGSENEAFRLQLTKAVGQVLENGLHILGIETVEKM